MIPGINLKVISEPDDDGLYKYQITLSDSKTIASLAFYEYDDCFKEFGRKLKEFPKSSKDVVTYELLKEDRKYAHYMLLRVFCYDSSGQSAIKVIVDNHSDEPDYHRCEFSIRSMPALINQLGQGLEGWNPKETKDFYGKQIREEVRRTTKCIKHGPHGAIRFSILLLFCICNGGQ